MKDAIEPYGGRLVDRILPTMSEGEKKEALELPRIRLSHANLCDLEMIAIGAFSPLEGFMTRADYEEILIHKRLESGLPWTIPITLGHCGRWAR